MSVLNKIWKIRNKNKTNDITKKILENRGLAAPEDVSVFMNPDIKRDLHDPFIMKDMDKAVKRIFKAIKSEEKIIIFGDYDVDGISGTAILYNTLEYLGAKVSYRLPHRVNDGYGLNEKFINEFSDLGLQVLYFQEFF